MLVFLATLSPLVTYGRLLAVGLARPLASDQPAPTWRPVVEPRGDRAIRPWLAATWGANRALVAAVTAVLLAALAAAVMIGAFGTTEAAAGLAPTLP